MQTSRHAGRVRLGLSLIAMTAALVACGGGSSGSGFAFVPPTTPTAPSTEPVYKSGYITLPDGNKMRYSLLLPNATGRFPTLVVYDGYSAGSYPSLGVPWVKEGYAVMGLNVPGTGCSTGDNQVFDESTGAAGAFAVEWAGGQAWSTGNIGMIGSSYSGYNQLWVAAHHPKGLKAITPSKNVADPYRDVGYPGGIPNEGFPSMWWGLFPLFWTQAADNAKKFGGDTDCAATAAANIEKLKRPDLSLIEWLKIPYADGLYVKRSANRVTHKINIPTLGNQSWQDEQIGPRSGYYEDTIAPDKMWLLSSNGDHGTNSTSDEIDRSLKVFLAHFVKGENNGFEKEPRVRVLQEMQKTDVKAASGLPKLQSRAVADLGPMPVKVKPMRLWLQPQGGLSDAEPTKAATASTDYIYPVASPTVNVPPPILGGKAPAGEGWEATAAASRSGELTFTTAALPEALSFYGEGSADIWLSATAPNTDLQVTVSEVRPDGQEMFVQRGWLRVSKRAQDVERSTELRPYSTFLREDEKMLVAGEPVLARVEINKFAHVFRAGSSIRVTVDTPSDTGYWEFGHDKTASVNTIWHDATRPSSVVLGFTPYAHAPDLPSCERTIRQPCRANTSAIPAGVGPRAPG
ncbi:MAG: CocE/NonD family hydrolase [Comamonadaceae bacterium]|nr:MAG: CocE/NonD family hydrolase [Comamonadaceae bacterium]